ncbi:glycoside hydrolase family 127 protein [Larkinella punicea]|uniref:Glycoside hydrolase family 127 protein n=1 Tax=Larkinella punicea TaxID=2315727 RepID=A0A368JVM4_9BACT|nr:glycoside hydrolase family 127 protein [Larkinella punicea]RCR70704.1 glycoside hydrolase family 127 protein [Larkinella punicea]
MKYSFWFLSVLLATQVALAQEYPITAVPLSNVKIQPGFWYNRLEAARNVTIPHAFHKIEETGKLDNFAVAGGLKKGTFNGIRFDESDVYKVVEGAAYTLQNKYDPKLDRYLDSLITLFAAAQEPDGYIYTIRTIFKDSTGLKDWIAGPSRYSFENGSHELYNVGHLYEAAIAHFQATGKRTLLDVAIKNANHLVKTIGPKPGQMIVVPGHEETEIALVKLYRLTGEKSYLDLARFFVDMRGRGDKRSLYQDAHNLGPTYFQDLKPVVQQSEAAGHAVRAQYLYAAMTDLAAIQHDQPILDAVMKIWEDATTRKQYITGGVGARENGEAFDEPYVLPNDAAYAETCAATANLLWNHRLFLLTGESKYMDVFERVLYNGFLGGVSIEGNSFFYVNPMSSNGKKDFSNGEPARRSPWFGINCCPSNVARFLPSLPGYIYALRNNELFINLFADSQTEVTMNGVPVNIQQQSNYPWDGAIKMTVSPKKAVAFPLLIRVPGWATNQPMPGDLYRYVTQNAPLVKLTINGKVTPVSVEKGYLKLYRTWKTGDVLTLTFDMPVREVVANEKVKATKGKVAIERGPIVYCAEGVDNNGQALSITTTGNQSFTPEYRKELLGGITVLKSAGAKPITLIPYYAWNNRGTTEMAVWFGSIGK